MMKKILLLAVIFTPSFAFAQSSGIAWKNGAVLTAQQLQQLDNAKINTSRIGVKNGVAPLDSNAMMSAAVSGDISNAGITNNSIQISLSNYLSNNPVNIKNYCGNINIGNQSGDSACIQNAINNIGSGKILEFYGNTVWPSSLIPDMSSNTFPFVRFNGYVINPSAVTDPLSNITTNKIIPDSVIFSTGSNYKPNSPTYERYSTTDNSYTPMMTFRQTNDGPSSNQQGSEVVRIFSNSSIHSTGNMDGLRTYLRSAGLNYAGSFDVNTWSSTQSYGTNWTWANISEMANAVPYYCPSNASGNDGICSEYDMNEDDLTLTGPDKAESAYDPSKSTRHVIGAGNGYNQVNIDGGTHVAWKANNSYFQNQIIVVKDSSGKPYMFYAWNKNAPSDKISDDPGYAITGSISGSTLTVSDTKNVSIKVDPTNAKSATCGVMIGWQIYSKQINKEVRIISQLTGTSCQTGTYEVQDMTSSTTNLNIPSGDINEAKGQPWSTSGSTKPTWTFNVGDKISDNSVVWHGLGPYRADTGSVFKYSGGNDTVGGYISRFGTLLETDTIWCYNALIDFSTAAWDPSNPYNVDMRVQPDTYFDFSDKATAATQNLHLLGFKSSDNTLEYLVNKTRIFGISDNGTISTNNVNVSQSLYLGKMTKAAILAITSPSEGQTIYDTDDHEEVTYRCPTTTTCGWFPVQYGTALSD